MKKTIQLISVCLCIGMLLIACGNDNSIQVTSSTIPSIPPSPTLLETNHITSTLEIEPALTEEHESSSTIRIDECVELGYSDSPNVKGTLVTYQYENEELIIEDTMTGVRFQVPDSNFGIAISQDFQRLLYINNHQNQLLEILANGDQKSIASANGDWHVLSWNFIGAIIWENNYTIENPFEPASLLSVDLVTGEYTPIQTSFPNEVASTERGTTWMGEITSIYDPTMKYAVYAAQYEAGKSPLILWDINNQREINRIFLDYISTLTFPVWNNQGVIVSAPIVINIDSVNPASSQYQSENSSDGDQPIGGKELFLVSYDGTIERLTYFTNLFYADQSSWSLSPDRSKLAVWLSLEEEFTLHPYHWELGILDMETKDVNWYCLPSGGERRVPFSPIWSPDGSNLLLTLGEDDIAPYEKLKVAIFNIESNELAILGEGKYGLGWLVWDEE